MLQLVKVKILDDITISHDGRYYIKSDIIEMTKKEAERLAKNIQIQILDNDSKNEPSPGMDARQLSLFNLNRRSEKKTTQKQEQNELQKLLSKFETK